MSITQTCPGIDDRGVLDLACRTGRRLLTFDADFGDPVFFHGARPPIAILYFRIHPIVLKEVLVIALRALAEVPDGHFAVVTQENTRLRPLAKKAVQ